MFVLERGLAASGFAIGARHPDVQSPGRATALRVRLDLAGRPVEVDLMDADRVASLWTLRNGKHNSFPYVKLRQPVLSVPDDDMWHDALREAWSDAPASDRRETLKHLAKDHPPDCAVGDSIMPSGLRRSVEARLAVLNALSSASACVPALLSRALHIDKTFAATFAEAMLTTIGEGGDDILAFAKDILIGRRSKGKFAAIPLYFDVERGAFDRDVCDTCHIDPVSAALSAAVGPAAKWGQCLLAGTDAALHAGNFPQPSVPVLGQIYLFSKNGDIPAAARYGLADDAALPIAAALPQRFDDALRRITAPELKGTTWRSIPSEKPKARDLLVAYVGDAPAAPVAAALAGDDEDVQQQVAEARDAFRTRAKRVVKAVEARIGTDFRKTPVVVLVLRKVDTGNAKAILHRAFSLQDLWDAVVRWERASDNVPEWLILPVVLKDGKVYSRKVTPIAPLQLPTATRATFIRGGTERAGREGLGYSAADALALLLNEAGAPRIAETMLRTVLARQGCLVTGAAHGLRRDLGGKLNHARAFDRGAALRAAGLLGLLLAQLSRMKEDYMTDPGFRLGQLLAVADIVHAGYCMEMRGGDVPPKLLGNSVLNTAQTDPERALAVLCRRWKPYGAWASRRRKSPEGGTEVKPHAAVLAAWSNARRVKPIADELGRALLGVQVDDRFRAELLLGYLAGLGPAETKQDAVEEQA